MLEEVKKIALKVKEAAVDLGNKANDVVHSKSFKDGVSTLKGHIQSGWDKVKTKRIKIEDTKDTVEETKK